MWGGGKTWTRPPPLRGTKITYIPPSPFRATQKLLVTKFTKLTRHLVKKDHILNSKMNFSAEENKYKTGNMNYFPNSSFGILSEEDILGVTLSTTYECMLGIQGFVIIMANLLTIISVCRYDFLWENCSSRFILSLACSDLLAGIRTFQSWMK